MGSGAIVAFAGADAPEGWLLCNGAEINRTTYATLFGVISTTYGVGNGNTTFHLPDLRGRFPLGLDNMGGTSADRGYGGGSRCAWRKRRRRDEYADD